MAAFPAQMADMRRTVLAFLAMVFVLSGLVPAAAETPMRLPVDAVPLVVQGPDGTGKARFDVEVARTGEQHMRGLMHRTDLPIDRGMLFVFQAETPRSFWMQNTPTPLDIVFADAGGVIVRIAQGTVPFSTVPIRSGGPAQYVLEVHAGETGRLGIGAGDRLVHPQIGRR